MPLPTQFRAAGVTCGIKNSGRPDIALFVSDLPCSAAGVFTTNRVVGAPVAVCRERLPGERIRGVVINSGNANACTGEQGRADALEMVTIAERELGADAPGFVVFSTGIIGVELPMDVIRRGIPAAARTLGTGEDDFQRAAEAMMTTDTFAKHVSKEVPLAGGSVTVAGAAKGAAMIAPNMATMLAVIMTDASISSGDCGTILRQTVDSTFNSISVDGHMSTSDSVLLMANGASGMELNTAEDFATLKAAVHQVCEKLATDIIRDAEGATHFVVIDVEGFDSLPNARLVAREIAESALVKTAIAGNDPNWGRITSAAGYAGVPFEARHLSLEINGVEVYTEGVPTQFDEAALSNRMQSDEAVTLRLTLNGGPSSGNAAARFWTSDLTQEYVRLNSEYTT